MTDAPRLEKMGVIEILDRSFQLYRENFLLFLSVLAVVQVPADLLQLLVTATMKDEVLVAAQTHGPFGGGAAMNERVAASMIVSSVVSLLIVGVAMPLATGALTRAVSGRYLNERTTVGACYSHVFKVFLKLLGTILLTGLVTMLGFFMCVAPGFLFMVWFVFSSSIVVLEGLGGTEAMGRSKQLSDGHRWRVVGMGLCMFLMYFVLGAGMGAANLFLLPKLALGPVHQAVAGQAIQQIFYLFLTPFFSVAWILLYYDVRIKKEGFDLEVLARSMATPKGFYQPPPGAPPSPQAPA